MVTTGAGASTKIKERAKAIQAGLIERQQAIDEELNASGIQAIEFEIARLENTIVNCNYDLNNSCKGNTLIIRKRAFALQSLDIKLKELEQLRQSENVKE